MNRERSSSANKVGKKSAFPILIASILLFTLAYPVAAQVPKPAGYYGSLMIDGTPAPAGTTVIAKIGDAVRGELITEKPGEYGSLQEPLWVTGYSEDENNPVVTFWVIYGEKLIKCSSPSSVIWVSGEIVIIPATATSTSNPTGLALGGGAGYIPTPSPALTPTPTQTPTPTPPPPVAPTPTPVVTPVAATPIITSTPLPALAVPPVIPLYVILIAIVVALVIIAGAYWIQRGP